MRLIPHSSRQKMPDEAEPSAAPLGGTRAEAVQRLQIGLVGLAAMLLMVMLANIVMERANQTDATAVPEAVDAADTPVAGAEAKDPLADAGVVPGLADGDGADGAAQAEPKGTARSRDGR